MITNAIYIFVISISLEIACGQVVGISCIFETTESPGICKLLSECSLIREDIIKNQRLPQICGFRQTQPIVCCPKNNGTRKPGDISKLKCKEYSSLPKETGGECGHTIIKRIVGGVVAGRKEFVHMAIVGDEEKKGNINWYAGGILISEQYVLTCARCALFKGSTKFVKLGITNQNDDNHKQEFKAIESIIHPDFKPTSAYNDIGLLKLEKSVEINAYVRPACLYTERSISVEKAIATGWGYTSYAGSPSDDLLKVTLNFVDYNFCNMTYKQEVSRKLQYGIVDDIQICAGSGQDGKDSCQGDSGGPLQIYHDGDDISCMYDVVGIVSIGKACGAAPGVYTRVSNYVKWIEDNVWPQK